MMPAPRKTPQRPPPYYHNGNRRRVEALTAQGWSASRIAAELNLAVGTVYSHRNAIRNRQKGRNAHG